MGASDPHLGRIERMLLVLVTCCFPRHRRREIAGDLLETHWALRRTHPTRSHRLWFAREIIALASWQAADAFAHAVRGVAHFSKGKTMRGFGRDLRHAVRSFARTPGFAAVTVLTLALGVGATTAIVTVVNAVVWSPLSFPDSERVVGVCERTGDEPSDFCGISPPNMVDLSHRATTLEGIGLARTTPMLYHGGDGVEVVNAGIGTPGFLTTLGARPLLGRLIEERDLPPSDAKVVVLSKRYWVTRFGADSAVLGRTVTFDQESYTVVGVLDDSTALPLLDWVSVWAPLPWNPTDETHRGWRGFHSIARLPPGVTAAEARAELEALSAGLATQYPATNDGHRFDVIRLRKHLAAPVRPQLMVFLGASILVFGIACVNVASLLLARAGARHKEFAVRASLGARPVRLLQHLLAESLILSAVGGVIGFWIGQLTVEAFVALAPPGIPRLAEVGIDGAVFAWALCLLVVTTALFGIIPALLTRGPNLARAIRLGGQWKASGSRWSARSVLVVAEVALAVTLLTGAGLLIRSFAAAARWDPGFPTEHLAIAWLLGSGTKYPDAADAVRAFESAADHVAAAPGVLAVGMAASGPLFGGYEPGEFTVVGQADPGAGRRPRLRWIDVDRNYFATLGLPIMAGRPFTESDGPGTAPVAIVNQEAARRLFPEADPLGQHIIDADRTGRSMQVVGIVQNVTPIDPLDAAEPVVYWPNRQRPRLATYLVVRTSGDPQLAFDLIEDRVHAVDPSMSVGRATTMNALMGDRLMRPRFQMLLVGTFAVIALILASVGIYGVVSYTVAGRTHEFGLRMTLGADKRSILTLVLAQGVRLGGAGLAAGWVGAMALTQLMSALLVGVTPRDPSTFGAVGVALGGVVLLATYLPAARAARIDPTNAMRVE
jgi:putative ABC transport system permease protein